MKLLLAFTILTISAASVSRADESDQQIPDIISEAESQVAAIFRSCA